MHAKPDRQAVMGLRIRAMLGSALFFCLAAGIGAGAIPWWISRWQVHPPWFGLESTRVAGAILIAAGLIAVVACFAQFAWQGLGTPAPPFPTRRLVVGGLYRYVRNPIYLGVLAIVVGQGALLGQEIRLAYGLLIWIVVHGFVRFYEERTLRASFGADYEAYRRHVHRWLPRWRAWRRYTKDGGIA